MHEIVNTGHVGTIKNCLGGWLPHGNKENLMYKALEQFLIQQKHYANVAYSYYDYTDYFDYLLTITR